MGPDLRKTEASQARWLSIRANHFNRQLYSFVILPVSFAASNTTKDDVTANVPWKCQGGFWYPHNLHDVLLVLTPATQQQVGIRKIRNCGAG